MDQTQSPPAPETPTQEVNRRAAQYVPQIEAGKSAVMLESMRRQATAYDKRVADSHRLGQKIVNAALKGVGGPLDMGNMTICGDITQHIHPPPSDPKTSTQQWPVSPVAQVVKETVVQKGLSGLAKTGIVAAMLASGGLGAAIPSLLAWWAKPAATAVAKDVGARIRVYWRDVELTPDKPLTTTVEEKSK
jgi:hypothetical protein